MKRVLEFLRKERLYLLLLVFVVIVTAIIVTPVDTKSGRQAIKAKIEKQKMVEDLAAKREEVEKAFAESPDLALIFSLTSLLMLVLLGLGITIDAMLISSRLKGKVLNITTYRTGIVPWGAWDVCRVAILFLFFGYVVIIIESALVRVFPFVRNDNFRMVVNSSILDTLGVVLILHFTIGQYGQKLVSLGISFKNFARNVFFGIVGYIALVPVLITLLIIIAYVSNLIKYVPEKQAVVDLFLKEKSAPLLIYTSLFAAIVGPIIEELFFRAFMYNALKKYMGVFWSILVTASFFAALHAHAVGFLPILALGVLLGYLYEKTGTLVAPVTVHMIHNVSMVGLVFLIKQLGVA